jgi:hypothetical protein
MYIPLKRLIRRAKHQEKGSLIILTIIFLFLGVTVVGTLSMLGGTSLRTGIVFNNKNQVLYAADSGIEDAKWQVKYDRLTGKFSTYNAHDYSTVWSYDIPQVAGQPQINNKEVAVTISNVWIPKDLLTNPNDVPDIATAESIMDDTKLMITGGPYVDTGGNPKYNIVITYYPEIGENLNVTSLGLWLPPGYTFKPSSSNLGSNPSTQSYQGGQVAVWNLGSTAFTSLPGANPTNSPMTAKITFAYYINGVTPTTSDPTPNILSWVKTSGVTGLSYTWDDSIRVFHITSTADSTTAETYISKNELRKTGGSLNGDYYATGNSLMRDLNSDGVKESRTDSSAVVASPNPAGADNGVPDDANVSASYLYWGTWYLCDSWASRWGVTNSNRCHTLFEDVCSEFSHTTYSHGVPVSTVYYWDNGSDWSVYNNNFRANGNNDADTSANRDLTKHSSFAFDLGTYPSPQWVYTLSWEQWYTGTTPAETDGLDYCISKDGGSTWSDPIQAFRGSGVGSEKNSVFACYQYNIPATYLTSNFKIKFHAVGFNVGGQYINIDDIRINALNPDTGMTFKINNGSGNKIVYFDSDGNPATSTNPANQIISDRTQVILTYSFASGGPLFSGFSQACFRDVTPLVQAYAHQPVEPDTNYNGHATYSVVGDLGDTGSNTSAYQLAEAGWSLVTIFTGPETLGHQLYLYDNFFGSGNDSGGIHIPWNGDGSSGGTIKGFVVPQQIPGELNAAKVTCFVTEGDNPLTGDYIALNGTRLWDGTSSTSNSKSSPNNVWNSKSYLSGGYTMYDGVDIDTLGNDPTASPPQYITWASNVLRPGDTSATIDLYTQSDYWFMLYMIISFRSETTMGGSLNYLIHG